jgi:hypothetical protein
MPNPNTPFDDIIASMQGGGHIIGTPESWSVPNINAAHVELTHAVQQMQNEQAMLQAGMKAMVAKKKAVVAAPIDALEFPVIAEVSADGTKRLWKTRYEMLESKYGQMHHDFTQYHAGYTSLTNENAQLMEMVGKQDKEIRILKSAAVDSEVVVRRIDQVCKELDIQLPGGRNQSLETRLNSFFGAIWVRIRSMEETGDALPE